MAAGASFQSALRRIEPTRRFALTVWWALAWRIALCAVLIGLAQGLAVGTLTGMFQMTPEAADELAAALCVLVGLPLTLAASWEALYRVLGKRFGDVELAVLSRD